MVLENIKHKRKCEEKSYQLDSASSGVMSGFDESMFLDVVVIILLFQLGLVFTIRLSQRVGSRCGYL